MNLLDIFEGREPHQQAIDRLEQARIAHLEEKMDYYAKHKMAEEFRKAKEERDSYYKVQDECMGYGTVVGEDGIGQDIVNKAEKMARATPPTKAGKVASTVKNAAKWLSGKGGPGKEGPTYESAEDIEDRGEYDQEGDMAKDNLHTIRREAEELERILGDNDNLPEWVQDKLANVKGMITAVSEYMQTQHERNREEATGKEGITIAESQKKNSEDPRLARLKARARHDHPQAETDDEALALHILDKEQSDVDQLHRDNEREDRMIARLSDLEQNLQKQINDLVADDVAESHMSELDIMRQDAEHMTDRQFMAAYKMSKSAFQQKYRTLLNPAQQQDTPVDEGWQDFNKVEPYAVCLAGKPVKEFDYYEDARRFHDNWKKKLYNQGEKEKADKITLMPIMKEFAPSPERDDNDDVPDQIVKLANRWWNSAGNQPKIESVLRSLGWSIHQVEGEDDAVQLMHNDGTTYFISADDFDPDLHEDTGSWIVYDPETKQIKKRFKTHTAGKSYAKAHGLGFASSEYYFDNVKQAVNELDVNTLKSYADKRGAQVAAMKADNPNPVAGSKEWIQQAVPAQQVNLAKRKIARKERQAPINEYFVRSGDDIMSVLSLNLFADLLGQGNLSDYDEEFANSPEWQAVVAEWQPKAEYLQQQLAKEQNAGRKLRDAEADALDDTAYDGSDAYESADMAASYLPKVYKKQASAIVRLLKDGYANPPAGLHEDSKMNQQQWMKSMKQQHPGVTFAQNKQTMKIFAMVPGKGKVATFDPNSTDVNEVRYEKPEGFGSIESLTAFQNQPSTQWAGPAHGDSANELRMFVQGTKPVAIEPINDANWKQLADSGKYPTAVIYQDGRPAQLVIGQPGNKDGVFKVHKLVQTAVERAEAGDFGPYKNPKYHRLLGQLLGYSPDQIDSFMSRVVSEVATDYSKRRQREKDVDAGKPVPKQRQSKMTDYQKRRAQDKKDMELGEHGGGVNALNKYISWRKSANKERGITKQQPVGKPAESIREESSTSSEAAERAILNRIMVAHLDLLKEFGPEKVMQAVEEVAYNVGDLDEIGSSDVSIWVRQVAQLLGKSEEQLDELEFLGSPCTKDCSGHRAGYDWSKSKGGRVANSPFSPSFNNGSQLYVDGK